VTNVWARGLPVFIVVWRLQEKYRVLLELKNKAPAYFHYGCALRCVTLRGERIRNTIGVSILYLATQGNATQRAAVMEISLY